MMPPMPTEQGLDANMAPSPQPQGGGLMALLGRPGMNGDMPPYMGGMLSRFAQQFRNAEGRPSTGMSAPRQLTQEEAMAITSMPQQMGVALPLPPQRLGLGMQMPMMQMPMAAPQGPSSDEIMRLLQEAYQPARVDNRTMIQTPGFRLPTAPQPLPQNAQGMALGGLMAKYGGGMC